MRRNSEIHAPRVCLHCGRPLEPWEVCNCQQAVPGMPKDGFRAKCPAFQYRSGYRGRSYIGCGGQKLRFSDCESRNRHYADYCCGEYENCLRMMFGEVAGFAQKIDVKESRKR